MVLSIAGWILAATAVVFCFVPRGWAAVAAYLSMVCFHLAGVVDVASSQLWFWGAAALIVLGLSVLLPYPVVTSRKGVPYVVVAAIAGLAVGLLISPNMAVLGGVAGAFCGALAYSRTPAGRFLDFPSRKFVNYLCAKALPPVITLSILAVTLILMLNSPSSLNLWTI